MCFSATASFTAAAGLSLIGIATLFQTRNKPSLQLLAFIPLLFALQQAFEGVVWLSLNGSIPFIPYGNAAKVAYLIFAFILWPIWIPLSLYFAESQKVRKGILLIFIATGTLLAAFNLYKGWSQYAAVMILDHSLQYKSNGWPDITSYYLAIVAFPCFVSSLKNIWLWGMLIIASTLLAGYFYQDMFISTWCFFAALVSLVLYKILRDINETNQIRH